MKVLIGTFALLAFFFGTMWVAGRRFERRQRRAGKWNAAGPLRVSDSPPLAGEDYLEARFGRRVWERIWQPKGSDQERIAKPPSDEES